MLLLASACGPASVAASAELDAEFVLTSAVSTMAFETTYCLEEPVLDGVVVSATLSVDVVTDNGRTVSLTLLDGQGGGGEGGDEDGSGGSDSGGEGDALEPGAGLTSVELTGGVGTIALQDRADWSGVDRRCATAVVLVSADGLRDGEEVRLRRPTARVSGTSYVRACEELQSDADSFSVELTDLP